MPSSALPLHNKVALITGASRGIGLALAKAFVEAGAQTVLSSRRQEALDEVAKALGSDPNSVVPIAAHTGDDQAVSALLNRIENQFGGLDIVVNNAATNPHFGPILTSEMSHWDKTFDVNVKGYFRIIQAAVPLMKKRGGGKIINVASVAGKRPIPGMGVYCVSKAAVLMLTEVLAAELAPHHIQVNAIVPGFIKTRFSQAIWDNPGLHEATLKLIPQRRMADPEELTGLALYLASEASNFVTGASFVIDGGQLISTPIP